MSESSKTEVQEPLHPLVEAAAARMGTVLRTLSEVEAQELLGAIQALPDEELGLAVTSLQRLAALSDGLGALDLAAQMVDLSLDCIPALEAATERLTAKKGGDRAKAQRARFAALTGTDNAQNRAPPQAKRPAVNVNTLRPPTKFV